MTAIYIVENLNELTYLVVCDENSNPSSICLNELIKSHWIKHPIEDISLIEMDVSRYNNFFVGRCFPYDQIEDSSFAFSRDDEITSVGFPNGIGTFDVNNKFTPFTFRSHFSSNEITIDFLGDGKKSNYYCLENPTIGGYSGGPVLRLSIVRVGCSVYNVGPTILVGITSGTINDDAGGKIACISPAKYIRNLV